MIVEWFKRFINRHIICTCEHPDVCFDCNKGNESCYVPGQCDLIKCHIEPDEGWPRPNQKGYVLISVMLILCLLTIIGIASTNISNTELAISVNESIYQMNIYGAEAGLEVAPDYLKANLTRADWDNPDWEGGDSDTLGNNVTYTYVINHWKDADGNIIRMGDVDGDYLWERNTTIGVPFEVVQSEGTHPRGGKTKLEHIWEPVPPYVMPEAALWVNNMVNGNGVSGAIVGEGPGDSSLLSKDYYDSDYNCPAVPDIKYELMPPDIKFSGNTGETETYELAGATYPFPQVKEALTHNKYWEVASTLGNKLPATIDLGTLDDPVIIIIDTGSDVSLNQNIVGAGILYVEGDLTISGNFSWEGLVLVNGNVTFNGGGAANSTMVRGSVVASGDAAAINGSVDLIYDCEVMSNLHDSFLAYKRTPTWRFVR